MTEHGEEMVASTAVGGDHDRAWQGNGTLRLAAEAAARGVFESVWGLRVTGLERVPRSGPLLLACNHVSLWEAPLLAVSVAPVRRPRFMGKRELFDIPVLGWFFRETGNIPIDRSGDVAAMRQALDTLARGAALAIFPEGTRVPPGQTRPPKPGVGFLAARASAPVVPVRVLGTARFPLAFPLEVRFGAPLAPPASDVRAVALAYASEVMDAIRAL